MFRNKRFQILSALILITAVSLGFYLSSGNDRPTNTPGPDDMYSSAPITPPFLGDAVGSWTQGAVIPNRGVMAAAVSYQRNDTGWLFVTGGDSTFGGLVNISNQRYNVNTNTWTYMSPMPTTLELHAMARLRDTIYVIAGMTSSFFSSETNICRKYVITTDTWSTIAPTPENQGPAGNRAFGYQDSLIYCIGGMNAGGSTAISTVYLYNRFTNSWRTATPLPAPRVMGACTVKGDTIVYVGGGTTYFAGYNNVTYKGLISQSDRSVITWTTGLNYPGTGGWRFDAAPWGCKGVILVGNGGGVTFGSTNECYVYSPGLNTWTQQPNITQATASASVGSVSYSNSVWKLIAASGTAYPGTFVINNTQIFTDTLCPPVCPPFPTTMCFCGDAAYTPITGSPGPSGDDNTITVPIGFSFCWNGVPYTNISICTNGFTVLGTTTFANFGNDLCTTDPTGLPMIAGFWDDLNTDVNGNIQYTTQGTAGNRVFIAQWTNVGYFSGSGNVTFQTKLYENGNRVEFHYGPATNNPLSSGSVGLSKSPGGSGNILSVTPGATCAATTISTTVCNNAVAWTNLTANRIYGFVCPLGIEPKTQGVPNEYSLSQNYPNPFNPATKISYALPKAGNVKLVVFDILGREVAVLVNEFKKAGTYDIQFNGTNLSSGVYFYKIQSGDFVETKKMLLVK